MKTSLDPRHLKRQKIVAELFAWNANKTHKLTDDKSQEIIKNIAEIDSVIKDCAPEWEIEKINSSDLAVLRLAIFELCFEVVEPPKAIIDEAVELAKEFGGENSPSFINGALAKALFHRKRTLRLIANKLGVEEEKLTPEANLLADLNATDLEIADLITILETDLHLTPPPTLSKFQTVGNILEYVEEHNE